MTMDKPKAVIFGAGGSGESIYESIKYDVSVVCIIDNDERR